MTYDPHTTIAASEPLAVAHGRPKEWAGLVLTFDLFAGDFGDGSERTLVDEIRVAKRGGTCRECAQPIRKGELVRVVKMADSEGLYGGRVCEACCDAFALSVEDGGEAAEARLALRHHPDAADAIERGEHDTNPETTP